MGLQLSDPLKEAVGKHSVPKLERYFGFRTVGDLVRHYPRRYARWNQVTPLQDLAVGERVTIVARVRGAREIEMKSGRGKMLVVTVSDDTGTLDMTFFNPRRLKSLLRPGRRALFSGTVEPYRRELRLTHPEVEVIHGETDDLPADMDRPIPIYRATSKVKSSELRKTVAMSLDQLEDVPDPIPSQIRARNALIGAREALEKIHRPATDADWIAARRRLLYEEAFVLQAALARRRVADGAAAATARRRRPGGLLDAFDERLPFQLTNGQVEVCQEIFDDLAGEHPMHRLLQGEVGSGKTLVALRAMLAVVDAGGQAALLAPTEVLAAQHHRSITQLLGDLADGGLLGGDERGTRVALLTGSQNTPTRRAAMLEAAGGRAGIVVGTHALLQERVQFADLGLVVVDEQHRFGVEQRDALRAKGRSTPHLLVMTATPIPRTVAMTVFGDLEISTLTELPGGRAPITSHVVPLQDRPGWYERVWRRVREEVDAGRQAFVVCTRIGDDEEPADAGEPVPGDGAGSGELLPGDGGDAPLPPPRSVLQVVDELRGLPELRELQVQMLHGRMPAEERDRVMSDFAAGRVHVLVATTVIEVGVDVPNASVMVVLDADRFGVSQLHQLRGRVGRGSTGGVCLLVTHAPVGSPSRARVEAVAGTVDGFVLARVDLEQRREGDVLGARQSGVTSSLRLLRALRDEEIIEQMRHEATALVAQDPQLDDHPALAAALAQLLDPEREAYLERG